MPMRAIRWLRQQKSDAPFFLLLSMAEPHSQFENPPEYNNMYRQYTRGEIIPIYDPGGIPKEKLIPPRAPENITPISLIWMPSWGAYWMSLISRA